MTQEQAMTAYQSALAKSRGEKIVDPQTEIDRLRAINAELLAALTRLNFAFCQKHLRGDDYVILADTRAAIAKAKGNVS